MDETILLGDEMATNRLTGGRQRSEPDIDIRNIDNFNMIGSIDQPPDSFTDDMEPANNNLQSIGGDAKRRGIQFKSAASNKRSIGSSNERGDDRQIVANRLTLLEDPNRPTVYPIESRSLSTSNMRETILLPADSVRSGQSIDKEASNPSRQPNVPANNNSFLDQSSFSIGCVAVAFILLTWIMYRWFYRKNNHKFRTNCLLSRESKTKRLQEEALETSISRAADASTVKNLGCDGERIELVDRSLTESCKEIDETKVQSRDHRDKPRSSICGQRSSSIVEFRQSLANNSFVVAARSAKPRVKLFSARMKKFIDDEAEGLQTKAAVRRRGSWLMRLSAYLVSAKSKAGLANGDQPSSHERRDAHDEMGYAMDDKGLDVTTSHSQQETPTPRVEIQPTAEFTSNGGGAEAKGTGNRARDRLISERDAIGLVQQPSKRDNYDHRLSTEPAINDACSSISNCSLYSVSPIECQSSSCGCITNRHIILSHSNHLNSHCLSVKSKSQGQSPCHMRASPGFYRSCCSATPALGDLRPGQLVPLNSQCESPRGLRSVASPRFQSQRVRVEDKIPTNISNQNGLSSCLNEAQLSSGLVNKCSSHIKRQYENYYEDERDEVYQRLTKSIGVQLALDFNHGTCNLPTDPSRPTLNFSNDTDLLVSCQSHFCSTQNFSSQYEHSQSEGPFEASIDPDTASRPYHGVQPPCKCCYETNASIMDGKKFHERVNGHRFPGSDQSKTSIRDPNDLAQDSGKFFEHSFAPNLDNLRPIVPLYSPLCNYQTSSGTPAIPKGILIQQPSSATPSPIEIVSNSEISPGSSLLAHPAKIVPANCVTSRASEPGVVVAGEFAPEMTGLTPIDGLASHLSCCTAIPRWKLKGRIIQQHGTSSNIGRDNKHPRRMSIAVDHISRASICNSCRHRSPLRSLNLRSIPKPRACTGFDGNWHIQDETTGMQPAGLQDEFDDFNQSYPQSHRPSNCSILDHQFCAASNSKSNHSSSGGSSSGIGVSGSACTNTPTSVQPYWNSMATKTDISADQLLDGCAFPYLCNDHAQLARKPDCHVTCPSRKYSLPVQLESQAADRISPNQTRFLFERNFQANYRSRYHQGEAMAPCQIPGNQELAVRGLMRGSESRRSSQTITRQSSFWLDDNTADSILSLPTSGFAGPQNEDGSQSEMSQLANEDPYIGHREADMSQGQQAQEVSRQPSHGSLILSAESIESVKQRLEGSEPSVQGAEEANREPSSSSAGGKSSVSTAARISRGRDGQTSSGVTTHLKTALSSSSTSSTTSSPSPDFSRASDRILARTSKSTNISKRNLNGKFLARRRQRPAFSTVGASSDSSLNRRVLPNPNSSTHMRRKDESEELKLDCYPCNDHGEHSAAFPCTREADESRKATIAAEPTGKYLRQVTKDD